jgi:hypothetical protein
VSSGTDSAAVDLDQKTAGNTRLGVELFSVG